MRFAALPGVWVLAGLAALAAGLYVLHQLRTRYRELTVVTTLFWRALVDEAPARTLRERFRHPWAYALILTICALVWIALAEPRFEQAPDDTFHVLVLDGSAGMAAGDRFAQAVDQLERYTSQLPAERRQVIWSGADLRPLLNPGEDELLLRRRLDGRAPEPAPASVERLVRQVIATRPASHPTSIVVFGDAPVRQPVIDRLPQGVAVKRASAPAPIDGNAGVTALGIADAASGLWDKVDVYVEVRATAGRRPPLAADVQIDLDGRAVPPVAVAPLVADSGTSFVIPDLPAAGGLLSVTLAGSDALALDDVARVRLPRKPIVHVLVSPSLAPLMGPAIEADPGARLTAERPDVIIRRAGEALGGDAPALEFVPAASQPQAFFLVHPETLDSHVIFRRAVEDIGLRQIDAMGLAQSSGRPIEVSIGAGRQWRISVWDELLDDEYNFTRSRAFPLFVANAVRWLAGTKAWYPYAAAGRPLSTAVPGERSRVIASSGRAIDPVGADFVPARAGDLPREAGDTPLAISLLDLRATAGTRDDALAPANLATIGFAPRTGLATWLLLVALGLLVFEWRHYQAGRLP